MYYVITSGFMKLRECCKMYVRLRQKVEGWLPRTGGTRAWGGGVQWCMGMVLQDEKSCGDG